MKPKKSIDSVKMMRDIRDKLSREFKSMSYEEQKKYIKQRVKKTGIGRLREGKKKIQAA